uniref:CTF/NF-I domain-containing protein n=1 Tax=Macrostomum lignano TaxID=282301 RepID=A0A1I8H4G3_9PLAT
WVRIRTRCWTRAQLRLILLLPLPPPLPLPPLLGENIVIMLCMRRVRRMGGRWYKAVSHIRTGKKKKEKKRIFKQSDYARLNEASDAAMDMTDTELADIVANLLKKIFKEIQDDYKAAFIRVWLECDDTSCVLTVPDGKGKMKRIDGLRGSDKVWRLDTLVAILFHGVPMDSTDTNLLVHRCEDELCINPRHFKFQCSPAMMAVTMEMLRLNGYEISPPPAPGSAASSDHHHQQSVMHQLNYFQFTSPFPVDVIRREMNGEFAWLFLCLLIKVFRL